MKICIDAGHSYETRGKRCPDDSMREYEFNRSTAQYVVEGLQQYKDVETMTTHSDNRDVPLTERTDYANEWEADVFVSIHANATGDGWSSAHGIETFVYTSNPPKAYGLATVVQRRLVKATGRYDRGVKSANFAVLRDTHMTAILVECGFMTNHEEAKLLKSDEYRRKCAKAIVDALAECYGLQLKELVKPDGYPDVTPEHWAYGSIQVVSKLGLMKGYPDGSFYPDAPVNRAELAKVANDLLYLINKRG